LFLILILLVFPILTQASEEYFAEVSSENLLSNFGRTGLISLPIAYTLRDGYFGLGFSYSYPYTRALGVVSFLPKLEMGGVITQIENISLEKTPGWKGYGKYKDKAFFVKYQLLSETKDFPAISVGYDDFHGTKLFESKYIVATKYIDFIVPQNLTIGYGFGKLSGPFFGTEVLLHPKFSFLLEYAPYKTEEMRGYFGQALSKLEKINLGLSFRPYSWMHINTYLWQKEHFGFTLALTPPFGKGLPKTPKHFILSEEDVKEIREGKQESFYAKALERLDLKRAKVWQDGEVLYIEYSNEGYLFESMALRKALDVLKVTYFPGVQRVKIIVKDRNLPVTSVEIPGYLINAYLRGKVDFDYLLNKANMTISPDYQSRYKIAFKRPDITGSVKIRTFLNDPSGAFKYQLAYDVGVMQNFSDKVFWSLYLSLPVYNNIYSINKPLMKHPVRSDIAEFLKQKKPQIYNLSLNYVDGIKILPESFVAFSVGFNEMMFAGVGGDFLKFFRDGRLALGFGGDYVYKRDPKNVFKLKKDDFYDYYLNFYYVFKHPEITINIKSGRFLAGDEGVRFQVSRSINGFEFGFWYTYSNTNKPQFQGANRGYKDKGVFFTLPLRVFYTKETKQVVNYSLSPWTRDVGQLAGRAIDLYNLLKAKLPFYLKDKVDEKE